jgi:hypothetical protein
MENLKVLHSASKAESQVFVYTSVPSMLLESFGNFAEFYLYSMTITCVLFATVSSSWHHEPLDLQILFFKLPKAIHLEETLKECCQQCQEYQRSRWQP